MASSSHSWTGFYASRPRRRQNGRLEAKATDVNDSFVLFGPDHLITLLLVAVLSVVSFRLGQGRWSGPINTVGGVVFVVLATALWLARLGDGFQANNDLPLSLCDIVFVLCAFCFFWPREWILTLIAYWGLAGTLQAMVTPDLLQAFPAREFLMFFVGHSVIVFGLFFLLGRNRYPRLVSPWGVGTAFLGLFGYALAVGSVNALTGWNYGYLRAKPQGASVLDQMGPWPWYIFGAFLFALLLFIAIAGSLRLLWNLSPYGDRNIPEP